MPDLTGKLVVQVVCTTCGGKEIHGDCEPLPNGEWKHYFVRCSACSSVKYIPLAGLPEAEQTALLQQAGAAVCAVQGHAWVAKTEQYRHTVWVIKGRELRQGPRHEDVHCERCGASAEGVVQ